MHCFSWNIKTKFIDTLCIFCGIQSPEAIVVWRQGRLQKTIESSFRRPFCFLCIMILSLLNENYSYPMCWKYERCEPHKHGFSHWTASVTRPKNVSKNAYMNLLMGFSFHSFTTYRLSFFYTNLRLSARLRLLFKSFIKCSDCLGTL